MKKIYFVFLIFILVLFVFSSCSDFLDEPLRDRIDQEDQDAVSAEQLVNGTYAQFTSWEYAFAYIGITEIISDNADKGSSESDTGADKHLLDNLNYTSSTDSFLSMWAKWYKSIGHATNAIKFTTDANISDEAYKNRLIGEAKFLRALNYFFLVRGWGDVPIQEIDLATRQPKAEVYAYIEKDLLDAIGVLPEKYSNKDLGRATKGAAMGLLSKVYLYQKKWQQAYDYASLVINSGNYGLESDYAVLWRVTSENGPESLFEFQARGDAPALGIQQYSQTQGATGETGWGWGFNSPTQNLLDAYNAEGDAERRDGTIIFRNSTLYDGRVVGNTTNPRYNLKAYSSANAGADNTDKNIRYLRLGEIYLIKAEAGNELGKVDEAFDDLKTIRDRVGLTTTTSKVQDVMRKAIWHERRLELAFEHDRWFDIIRTGEAKEAMAADGKNFIVGKHELFPVPYLQILQTPTMTQNPGWN